MKQIYSETVVFDEKTSRSFSTWCSTAKLDPTLADQTCKIQKDNVSKTKIRYRSLWVLRSTHRESITRQILNVSEGCIKLSDISYRSASDELFVKRDATTTTFIPRTTGNTQVIENIESHNVAYYLTREQLLSYETIL